MFLDKNFTNYNPINLFKIERIIPNISLCGIEGLLFMILVLTNLLLLCIFVYYLWYIGKLRIYDRLYSIEDEIPDKLCDGIFDRVFDLDMLSSNIFTIFTLFLFVVCFFNTHIVYYYSYILLCVFPPLVLYQLFDIHTCYHKYDYISEKVEIFIPKIIYEQIAENKDIDYIEYIHPGVPKYKVFTFIIITMLYLGVLFFFADISLEEIGTVSHCSEIISVLFPFIAIASFKLLWGKYTDVELELYRKILGYEKITYKL